MTRRSFFGGALAFGEQTLDRGGVRQDAAGLEGRKVILGFRPEAVSLQEQEDACRVQCRVELTEMLGDNTNIYIASGGQHAILKVDSHETPETDKDLTFFIPHGSIYLFDGETEQAI